MCDTKELRNIGIDKWPSLDQAPGVHSLSLGSPKLSRNSTWIAHSLSYSCTDSLPMILHRDTQISPHFERLFPEEKSLYISIQEIYIAMWCTISTIHYIASNYKDTNFPISQEFRDRDQRPRSNSDAVCVHHLWNPKTLRNTGTQSYEQVHTEAAKGNCSPGVTRGDGWQRCSELKDLSGPEPNRLWIAGCFWNGQQLWSPNLYSSTCSQWNLLTFWEEAVEQGAKGTWRGRWERLGLQQDPWNSREESLRSMLLSWTAMLVSLLELENPSDIFVHMAIYLYVGICIVGVCKRLFFCLFLGYH